MLVKLVHEYGFWTGLKVPAIQVKGPFSVSRPDSEEHLQFVSKIHRDEDQMFLPRTTVQPDRDLLGCLLGCRRPEPEE